MAKLEDGSAVNSTYFKVLKSLFLVSCITSLIIIILINSFNASIINYFSSIGVSNVNVTTLCYGFIHLGHIVIPTLIYPYAKVVKNTLVDIDCNISSSSDIFFLPIYIF